MYYVVFYLSTDHWYMKKNRSVVLPTNIVPTEIDNTVAGNRTAKNERVSLIFLFAVALAILLLYVTSSGKLFLEHHSKREL